ncbi:MAG: UDP-N-acetylmuramate dehydrogenase [Patescibacteria group bacterium]
MTKVFLKDHTTFKIGGPAGDFVEVKNQKELVDAISSAINKKLPIFILGGGSNILLSDAGFDGTVIKIATTGIRYVADGMSVRVVAEAGESWDGLVADTVARGLFGLENLSGIPGTVGAAPIQNIGAYGVEVKDTIEWVEVLDKQTLETKRLSHADCQFAYRHSFFKTPPGKSLVVLRVCFLLKKNGTLNLVYKDIGEYGLKNNIEKFTLITLRQAILEIRKSKFPDLTQYGTAGSFFKNPIICQEHYDGLKKHWPNLPGFPMITSGASYPLVKVPLAWILDNICGLKGTREGTVGLFQNQPLVLTNFGGSTAKEVTDFSKKITALVLEKTGISIEPEVEYISYIGGSIEP